MIEEGQHTVNVVAQETGFADRERMRRAFHRTFGVPAEIAQERSTGGGGGGGCLTLGYQKGRLESGSQCGSERRSRPFGPCVSSGSAAEHTSWMITRLGYHPHFGQ